MLHNILLYGREMNYKYRKIIKIGYHRFKRVSYITHDNSIRIEVILYLKRR